MKTRRLGILSLATGMNLLLLLAATPRANGQDLTVPLKYIGREGKSAFDKDGLSHPSVCRIEVDCAKQDLAAHFKASGAQALAGSPSVLTWSGFLQKVNGVAQQHPEATVGVKFHYGLVDQPVANTLVLAFELVDLQRRPNAGYYDEVDIPGETGNAYVIQSNGTFTNGTLEDWKENQRSSYFNTVQVARLDAVTFEPLAEGSDREAYTFLWSDLQRLIADNEGADRLHIHSVASPTVRTDAFEHDWGHDLVVVAANASKEFLATGPYIASLRDRALDLGSPCPPRCRIALFRPYGLAARTNCACPAP
ncbi:MAG: hypothetical protein KDB88_11945 [Flavobacteriales bacterium]|nr:hypothetical protein [Flavobacteriales bacterium]